MIEYKDAKRIWILGDIHFGIRAHSMEWLEITNSYFNNFFIPLLEENYKPGDILIQLGDVYENRQVVNTKFNNNVIQLFERLSNILPVHIIAGNHDLYYKTSNDISSLDSLKYIPSVNIYKEPELIKFGQRKCLLLPWQSTHTSEAEVLTKYKSARYVFCHSEAAGFMLNKKVKQTTGTKLSEFKDFFRVYSGHIHYSQVKKNVYMVGNAYQMTRSDCNNPKGVYLLDLETEKHQFFENNYSPKFVKINIKNVLDITLGEFKDKIRNNFLDLYIPSDIPIKYNLSYLMNLIQDDSRKIEPNIYDEDVFIDVDEVDAEIQNGYKNFDIINLCNKYIENKDYDNEIKEDLKKKIVEIYTICSENYNPEL